MALPENDPLTTPFTVDPQVRIGHVHLKVADLQRALRFYSGVLGLEVTQRYGDGAVFLSAGGYSQPIALKPWESLGGSPPPPRPPGAFPPPPPSPPPPPRVAARAECLARPSTPR